MTGKNIIPIENDPAVDYVVEEAKKAKGCLDWIHHCKAECCRGFLIDLPKEELKRGMKINVRVNNPASYKRYYALHDAELVRNTLRFTLGDYEIKNNKLFVKNKCKLLRPDWTCGDHENKPFPCKDFDETKVRDPRYHCPDTCLFLVKDYIKRKERSSDDE